MLEFRVKGLMGFGNLGGVGLVLPVLLCSFFSRGPHHAERYCDGQHHKKSTSGKYGAFSENMAGKEGEQRSAPF